MSFQIKSFADIVLSQINHARGVTKKITDFQPGSVARTLMEAPAVEVEELYLQMFLGLRDAIPVATFLSFGFDRLPASRAQGIVSLSSSAPLTQDQIIPLGTVFTTDAGKAYASTAEVVWVSGHSIVNVPVSSDLAGVAGNAVENEITLATTLDADFIVGNASIATGRDIESDSEREARFAGFIAALSRGTVAACSYGASQAVILDGDGNQFEYVTRSGLIEYPGYVTIFVYSNRGTPSADLLANGQQRIDGYRNVVTGVDVPGFRAAGIRVDVLAMIERTVDLSIQVKMLEGYVLTTAVMQRLGDVYSSAIAQVQPGSVLYLGTIIDLLLAVAGVEKIVPITSSNVICGVSEVLIAGNLSTSTL